MHGNEIKDGRLVKFTSDIPHYRNPSHPYDGIFRIVRHNFNNVWLETLNGEPLTHDGYDDNHVRCNRIDPISKPRVTDQGPLEF